MKSKMFLFLQNAVMSSDPSDSSTYSLWLVSTLFCDAIVHLSKENSEMNDIFIKKYVFRFVFVAALVSRCFRAVRLYLCRMCKLMCVFHDLSLINYFNFRKINFLFRTVATILLKPGQITMCPRLCFAI